MVVKYLTMESLAAPYVRYRLQCTVNCRVELTITSSLSTHEFLVRIRCHPCNFFLVDKVDFYSTDDVYALIEKMMSRILSREDMEDLKIEFIEFPEEWEQLATVLGNDSDKNN